MAGTRRVHLDMLGVSHLDCRVHSGESSVRVVSPWLLSLSVEITASLTMLDCTMAVHIPIPKIPHPYL